MHSSIPDSAIKQHCQPYSSASLKWNRIMSWIAHYFLRRLYTKKLYLQNNGRNNRSRFESRSHGTRNIMDYDRLCCVHGLPTRVLAVQASCTWLGRLCYLSCFSKLHFIALRKGRLLTQPGYEHLWFNT